MDSPKYLLSVKDMIAGYNSKPVVKGLSMDLIKGRVTCVIGPNGAGKSTILKTLARQIPCLGGAVYVSGKKWEEYSLKEYARTVSVMLTEQVKTDLMTGWDVVALGRYAYTGFFGTLTAEDKLVVEQIIRLMNLEDLVWMQFSKMSDGQKQRVLIARAICQRPDLLLLDEPTSYLDIAFRFDLMILLRRLASQGMTVIMTLHEIDLAQKVSDNFIFVNSDGARFVSSHTLEQKDINDLFGMKVTEYDTVFSGAELPPIEKKPEVFVMSSGGSGVPVFRELRRMEIPFAAGILYENDADYIVACKLSSAIITETPFEEISDKKFEEACHMIDSCDRVIDAGVRIGSCNRRMADLKKYAGGKLCPK